jgi:hypothetical protein
MSLGVRELALQRAYSEEAFVVVISASTTGSYLGFSIAYLHVLCVDVVGIIAVPFVPGPFVPLAVVSLTRL